jgi:hypothetical protein
MLRTSYLDGSVIDSIAICFDLSGGMDRTSSTVISVLPEYANSFSSIGKYLTAGIDDLEGIQLVIVNTGYVDFPSWILHEYFCIRTENASVCSPID